MEIFGTDVPLKRAGQPFELAPAYLYLASDDSKYVTGQILHVNGGSIVWLNFFKITKTKV